MAEIMIDSAEFKVIKVSQAEIIEKLGPLGAVGVCDYCMSQPKIGYYVAVLDQWLCPKCYDEFIKNNSPNPRDTWFEDERFAWFKTQFQL